MNIPDPNRWTLEQLRDGGWACTESVELVTMPCCGFTYEADRAHEDGTFTCPACAERVLLEACKEMLYHASLGSDEVGSQQWTEDCERMKSAIELAEGREPAP